MAGAAERPNVPSSLDRVRELRRHAGPMLSDGSAGRFRNTSPQAASTLGGSVVSREASEARTEFSCPQAFQPFWWRDIAPNRFRSYCLGTTGSISAITFDRAPALMSLLLNAPGGSTRPRAGARLLAGVGIILGAGIYVLVGEAAGEAGGLVWVSFLIAALVTTFTGLSYAELSSMFPRAGAGYEYTRQAFGITTGFLTGWLTIVAEIIAASAVALGFGGYFEELTGIDPVAGAVILLLAGVTIAASGALGSVLIAGILTLVEAAGLIFVSSIGLIDFEASNLTTGSGMFPVLGGSALVFFAYIGFEDIATFAEEVKQPERTIPGAILIAIVVSAFLYVIVSVTAVAAVGAEGLAESSAPLALVAETVLNDSAGDFLAAIALAATANTALLLLMAAARRIYGMSDTGALPPFLSRVTGRTGIPLTGLIIVAGLAAAGTLRGDVGEAAELTNFALFVAFALVNSAVIALRVSRPEARRPFRIPGRTP